jgi:hypothetical protein
MFSLADRLRDGHFRSLVVSRLRQDVGSTAGVPFFLFPPILVAPEDQTALARDLGVSRTQVGSAVPTLPSLVGQHYFMNVMARLASEVEVVTNRLHLSLRDGAVALGDEASCLVVASRRAAFWLEEQFGWGRPNDLRYPRTVDAANVWLCGRARKDIATVSAEWTSALFLAERLR